MYCFIIMLIIVLIITGCLTKGNKRRSLKLYIPIIGGILCIVLSSFIASVRLDKLKTKIIVSNEYQLVPTILKTDTTYIKYDTLRTDTITQLNIDSTIGWIPELHKFYKICKWHHIIKNKKYDNIKINNVTTLFKINENDTTILLYSNSTKLNIHKDVYIKITNANKLVELKEKYIGDEWTSNISLLTAKRTFYQLELKQSTYDSLQSLNPKIVKLWNVN